MTALLTASISPFSDAYTAWLLGTEWEKVARFDVGANSHTYIDQGGK